MLGFEKLFENKTLMISAGAVAILVAALLILFIFRLAFGRRLHMPGGGRARQPRLGVVDAFDLDRQRQLVLVRRDNVEHLVMIGGPNDVLIESQIVRVEARETPRPRDKEPTVAPLPWPAGSAPLPASGPPPAIAPEPKPVPGETVAAADQAVPLPPAALAPPPVAPTGPAAPPAPLKRPPFLPLPPRRPVTPPSFGLKPAPAPAAVAPAEGGLDTVAPPPSPLNPSPLSPSPLSPVVPGPGPAGPTAAAPSVSPPSVSPLSPSPLSASPLSPAASGLAAPRPPISPPAFLRPRQQPGPSAAPPVASARPEETTLSAAPAVVAPQPTEPEKAANPVEALESLEEEMAKLLGRSTKEL